VPYSDVILTGSWDGCVRVWRLSDDKRKIEVVGVLGGGSGGGGGALPNGAHAIAAAAGKDKEAAAAPSQDLVRGIINDIAMFERGERGRDGLCVVAVTGKELRLGRWKNMKEGQCGAVIFEVPKVVVKKPDEAELNGGSAGSDDGDD
jgi:ribosomal RNA-processing protein 9